MSPPTPEGALPRSPSELTERIRSGGPALVALSGGVDSGLVASLAREALGTAAVAVTLGGTAVSDRELRQAQELAGKVGIEHVVLPVDPLTSASYRANGADRCYHCRTVEASALRALALQRGTVQLLDGLHADDLTDDRPGIRAMDEAGFFHPLLWAGWGKERVRDEARSRGLPNWDRPSDACLASRVARGEPISAELLQRIDRAEEVLHARGFRRVRVRVRAGAARVEVDPDELARFRIPSLVEEVIDRLRALGFDPVSIDPRGYRGSGNALPVVR